MAKILGYSKLWDKLKPQWKLIHTDGLIEDLRLKNFNHTTIRLDKGNGYYKAGEWQEVLKPRSPHREIIRHLVHVGDPIKMSLGEILKDENLVLFDTMLDDLGMVPMTFYNFCEKNYGKGEFWDEYNTPMMVLPIKLYHLWLLEPKS